MPWSSTVSWDVTDAATGGTSADGRKTVRVKWDDGAGTFTALGSDSIYLIRTPPVVGPVDPVACDHTRWTGWIGVPCWPEGANEFSLDGGPWTSRFDIPIWGFDLRTLRWGGNWRSEDRQLCARAWDWAGLVSQPVCYTFDLNIPSTVEATGGPVYDVRFELPRPAVTGELFTIRPVYPPDFPANLSTAYCEWTLRWGDDGTLHDFPNENYGSVQMTEWWREGGCGEWTFTLPYTPGLTYQFDFAIKRWREPGALGYVYLGTNNMDLTTFRATVGTFERGIPHSTIGLAYLLPEQFVARPGEPVTYTIHASDTPGWTLPKPAWFWATNYECEHNVGDDHPTYSNTFTYTPDCQGPWQTGWAWFLLDSPRWLRAEFDPPADKAKPVVSMPVAAPREGSQLTSVVPTTISWTASDPTVHKVATGVVRTKLQVSRNGGMWKNVTLGSAAATSVVVNLTPSGSYRFRVRAFDRAGNVSAWVAGPKFRPRLLQQSQATLSADWSGLTDAGLSGGSAVSSYATAATASLSFYGRAISWIGSVGPGAGLAQVYVDGTLTETVDLHAATTGVKRILFSHTWATLGSHSLRIVVLGTYGRPEVIVDAFAVFN